MLGQIVGSLWVVLMFMVVPLLIKYDHIRLAPTYVRRLFFTVLNVAWITTAVYFIALIWS